jgi:hypothetical protein
MTAFAARSSPAAAVVLVQRDNADTGEARARNPWQRISVGSSVADGSFWAGAALWLTGSLAVAWRAVRFEDHCRLQWWSGALLNTGRIGSRYSVAQASELPRGSSSVTSTSTPMLLARRSGLPEGLAAAGFAALRQPPARLFVLVQGERVGARSGAVVAARMAGEDQS